MSLENEVTNAVAKEVVTAGAAKLPFGKAFATNHPTAMKGITAFGEGVANTLGVVVTVVVIELGVLVAKKFKENRAAKKAAKAEPVETKTEEVVAEEA